MLTDLKKFLTTGYGNIISDWMLITASVITLLVFAIGAIPSAV